MKYLYLEPLNPAQAIARATYLRINDVATDWFREFGGVSQLPESFDVSGEGWLEAERQIDEAAKEGNIELTSNLCEQYQKRALAYFEGWRKKLRARKEAFV